MALSFAFFWPSDAAGQPAFSAFASPNVGGARPVLRYRMLVLPSEQVSGQGTFYSSLEQQLFLSVPVWQNRQDELTFQGSVRAHVIETDAVLPTTGEPFPKNLTDVRFGPTYRRKFSNDWTSGISIQFGSASDVPFGRFDDAELIATWFMRIPSGKRNAWVAFLNYSNNRDFANHIPLPGFGFVFGGNRWCRGLIGLPVIAATLFPEYKANLSLTYLPLLKITAELGYDFIPPVRAFTEFVWSNETYFRNAQPDKKLRLFLVDKRISGGVRLRPARWAELKLAGGWVFDRNSFESRSVYKDRDYNRIDFGAGPFASVELNFRMLGKASAD
ncbi:MAG TPA: hypothetical protein PLZ86_01595 [bacterium]|nr:hypothetical protein [bacterium]